LINRVLKRDPDDLPHVCELDLKRPISVCRPMPNFAQETSALM